MTPFKTFIYDVLTIMCVAVLGVTFLVTMIIVGDYSKTHLTHPIIGLIPHMLLMILFFAWMWAESDVRKEEHRKRLEDVDKRIAEIFKRF